MLKSLAMAPALHHVPRTALGVAHADAEDQELQISLRKIHALRSVRHTQDFARGVGLFVTSWVAMDYIAPIISRNVQAKVANSIYKMRAGATDAGVIDHAVPALVRRRPFLSKSSIIFLSGMALVLVGSAKGRQNTSAKWPRSCRRRWAATSRWSVNSLSIFDQYCLDLKDFLARPIEIQVKMASDNPDLKNHILQMSAWMDSWSGGVKVESPRLRPSLGRAG